VLVIRGFAYSVGAALLVVTAVPSESFSGGPVYINPNAGHAGSATIQPSTVAGGRLTQTVYGFLDFTTTIGNTVMVFSPQSAPAPGKSQLIGIPFYENRTKPHADPLLVWKTKNYQLPPEGADVAAILFCENSA